METIVTATAKPPQVLNDKFIMQYYYSLLLDKHVLIVCTSKEPVCPRVENHNYIANYISRIY